MLVGDPWHWVTEDGSIPTVDSRLRRNVLRVVRLVELFVGLGFGLEREAVVVLLGPARRNQLHRAYFLRRLALNSDMLSKGSLTRPARWSWRPSAMATSTSSADTVSTTWTGFRTMTLCRNSASG